MKCPGCGAELQFDDPSKPGYIPFEVYERRLAEGKEILCQRCYRLKHYGKLDPVKLDENFIGKLKNVLGSFKLVLWVIDVTDFEGTYRKEIRDLVAGKKVIYAVTKIDLLPKAITQTEIKEWLIERIKPKYPKDVRLISSLKGFGINSLKKHLLSFGVDKALVIGVTNVGKSSLINKLAEHPTLISPFPGTTLGLLRRKMKGARFYIYDTPGITTSDRFSDLLSVECQKEILPSRELTRKTFKPERERAILIGGLARLLVDYDTKLRPIFQIFTYEKVKLHETKSEKAEQLLKERVGDFLIPPCSKSEVEGLEFMEKEFEVDEEHELAFPGLGWINVKRGPVIFKALIPRGVKVVKRPRLVKPKR